MLSVHARPAVTTVVAPLARTLNKAGISPNTVTVVGTLLTMTVSISLIVTDHLVAAAIATAICAAFDLLDGTMARQRGGGTRFGAALDATCDRLADGALFGALVLWIVLHQPANWYLLSATLIVLVTSQVISYAKARGEASGLQAGGGLIERAERLIIGLVTIGLAGFGVPLALEIGIGLLAVGSVITVIQRLHRMHTSPGAHDHIAPPEGACDGPA